MMNGVNSFYNGEVPYLKNM